jgi:hypothetical protein
MPGIDHSDRPAESYCGGIGSRFTVGQRIDATKDEFLTSATISEIPSSSGTPDGMGYRSVWGGFSGPSAPLLLQALGNDTFYIDYNFDFDQRNVRYGVPTAAISDALTKWRNCIGNRPVWYLGNRVVRYQLIP